MHTIAPLFFTLYLWQQLYHNCIQFFEYFVPVFICGRRKHTASILPRRQCAINGELLALVRCLERKIAFSVLNNLLFRTNYFLFHTNLLSPRFWKVYFKHFEL